MRLAAIDVGTNSTKLIVADVSGDGALTIVSEQAEVTRLGEGVDATRRLSDAAQARTLEAISRFAEDARQLGAVEVLGAGTSALRDAENGSDFLADVVNDAGVEIEIISGDREAQLAFFAVASDPSLGLSASDPLLVFDIGGGSTELILGSGLGVGRHRSLDVGAVRLTERFLRSDPPTASELAQAAAYARDALNAFSAPDLTPRVMGIGGTALNVAAVTLGLTKPDPAAVHALSVSHADVAAALTRFQSVPLAGRRVIPGLEPKRADVIVAGALLLDALLTHLRADHFTLSARGLRYGLLAEYAKSRQGSQGH